MSRTRLAHIVSTTLVALGAAFLMMIVIPKQIESPKIVIGTQTSGVTPRLIPQIWAALLIVVSATHLVVALFLPNSREAKAHLEPWPREARWRALVAILLVGSYVLLAIPVVGFYASTFVYLAVGAKLLTSRSILEAVAFAVAVPVVFYLFFRGVMNVNPPQGLLI